jgi:hypothetical protein
MLLEEKDKYLFYKICHNFVVPIHIVIYGHSSPPISKSIMGNLGNLVDRFIEDNVSYIRVFGCSIPPHALPQFLPDRLV